MEEEGNGNLNEVVDAQFGEQPAENIENAFAEKEADEASQKQEETEEESVDFNKKFAALSKRDKELRNKEAEYDSRLAELQEKFERLENPIVEEPEIIPEIPLKKRLMQDPLGTLKELGFDYEQLTELALNDGKLSTDMQMKLLKEDLENDYKAKYEELAGRFDAKEKAEEESNYAKTIENFKNEINEFVASDAEAYELIQANNAQDLVYDVIEEHYNDTGNVLDNEEAANAVESYLLEEAKKVLTLKKLSPKQEAAEDAKPIQKSQSTTLSNAHSAQAINETDQKLSREESLAKVAGQLRWD